MSTQFPSYDLFGTKISLMTTPELLELLASRIDSRTQSVLASQNMHGLHVRLWDAASRQLHGLAKTYVHIDGMPLVALCRLSGIDAKRRHRVTLNDFIWPLLALACQEGWQVCYVGSNERVLAAGIAEIEVRLPRLKIVAHQGYFRTQREADATAHAVAAARPQLILVGMGMGRQERWILQHLELLAPASIVTVGACMEYIAGAVKTPPRWMGRLGCEWLFRLTENPRRFWYRYLVEPWFVLAYIFWFSTLGEMQRLAGRIEELQPLPREVRDPEFSESA